MTETPTRGSDRSFAPVLLVGVGAAILAAVASTRDWARASGGAAGIEVQAAATGSDSAPLAAALALVGLASWGALLVTRGRFRRLVSLLGLLASVGVLVTVLAGSGEVRVDALAGVTDGSDPGVASLTAWYFTTAASSAVAAVAFAVSSWRSPGWPAMGTRYDAPAARTEERAEASPDEDMWRALDQGRDPTS